MGWSDVRHHYEDYSPEDCAPSWRTLSDSKHTARTPKGCQICAGTISPGQRYRKLVALTEGEFNIICSHEDCGQCAAAGREREEAERRSMEAYHAKWDRAARVWMEEDARCDALDADLWARIAEHFAPGGEI